MTKPEFWKDRRILITGIKGFAGSWLAEKLVEQGADVYGLVRASSATSQENITHLLGKIKLLTGDICDVSSIISALKESEAEIVFHLASQSYVTQSFSLPLNTYYTNVIGTGNILEAVRICEVDALHFAGSSEEFGNVPEGELPATELTSLNPISPYAVSKVAGDMMCYAHYKAYGIPVVRTRAFNHTGVRAGESYVVTGITRQAAEIKAGVRSHFTIGNAEVKRDFSDVRDITRGYIKCVESGKKGAVYVLCSGKAISIRELIERVSAIAGIPVDIRQDSALYRPSEIPVLFGSYARAKDELGWEPEVGLDDTLSWMIKWQAGKLQV